MEGGENKNGSQKKSEKENREEKIAEIVPKKTLVTREFLG